MAKAGIATSDRLFLPTPSARRATWSCASRSTRWSNFYPRPPRGGRPNPPPTAWEARNFYPRPPRGGRRGDKLHPGIKLVFLSTPSARRATLIFCLQPIILWLFLSTPSARRATLRTVCRCHQADISIHALREEGDSSPESSLSRIFDFYPRPPRGGRPIFS